MKLDFSVAKDIIPYIRGQKKVYIDCKPKQGFDVDLVDEADRQQFRYIYSPFVSFPDSIVSYRGVYYITWAISEIPMSSLLDMGLNSKYIPLEWFVIKEKTLAEIIGENTMRDKEKFTKVLKGEIKCVICA